MYIEKGPYRKYAKIVKENVDVPVIVAGRMDDPDMALAALEDGTCDMISLGRPLLADPDYVNKLRRGDVADIRPCLSCQEGCMGRIQEYSALNCAVNPQACRERYAAYTPVIGKPKDVLIVGGGVAGLEAARVLAIRGHHPHLFEASDKLGGNLIPGGAPKFKEDDHALVRWYEYQMKKLNVDVTLNKKVTREDVLANHYDAVIIATGSTPKLFSLGDGPVYSAEDVLNKKVDPGQNVAVIGGGLVGCELALDLQDQGKKVSLVEALDKLLALNGPLCAANKEMLERLVPYKGVDIYTSSKANSYDGTTLKIDTKEGSKEIKVDSVVLAVGYKEENSLYESLQFDVPDIHLLGDARKVSNIMYAIWDAFEVANHL
jgi:2-enoate reductase